MADQPTQKGQRRSGGTADKTADKTEDKTPQTEAPDEPTQAEGPDAAKTLTAASEEPTVTDAGSGTGATDGTSEVQAVESNVEGAETAAAGLMGVGGFAPGGNAPVRDQAVSNATRNPSPVDSVTGRGLAGGPDYTAANVNSMRSSASPIDHPGVPTRDEHNPNRIALAAGLRTLPGEGHVALVGEDGRGLTFAEVFPGYTVGDTTAASAVRVYERFTQPNVKARNYSTRLLFGAGAPVPVQTVEKMRLALIEEGAALGAMAGTIGSVAPNSGPAAGGTVVTINGTGFTGATGVTFGGVAGTAFAVLDGGTVRVTAPAHAAGRVDVVVASSSGPLTLRNGYTYL